MNPLEVEAKRRLSAKRYTHVLGVVEAAEQLAKRNGVDPHQAMEAAWLHDLFRELPEHELRKLALDCGMAAPAGDPQTWHGPICAQRAAIDFGVTDPDIRAAVACHTVGHPHMGKLSQVLYVADAIEKNRLYPGVDLLRRAAQDELSIAVACVADATIFSLLERRQEIALDTVALRNRMWSGIDNRKRKAYSKG